jgi:hypothetical protein
MPSGPLDSCVRLLSLESLTSWTVAVKLNFSIVIPNNALMLPMNSWSTTSVAELFDG